MKNSKQILFQRRCESLSKPPLNDLTLDEPVKTPRRSYSTDPIQELHIALGRGAPGSRAGTVKRWIEFKKSIRIRQLNIEAKRVRKRITYNKSITGVDDVESDDSYKYYLKTVPQKGEDERKTRSLMSWDSYTELTGLRKEDLMLQKETLISSDDEDDFDRDYKISSKDRRREQRQRNLLAQYFKQMIYKLVESSYEVMESSRVRKEKQRRIDLKENEKLKFEASKAGIIQKFRQELSPEQYGGLLRRKFTILEPLKPATEFAVPIDTNRYKYSDWRSIYLSNQSIVKATAQHNNSQVLNSRNNTVLSSPLGSLQIVYKFLPDPSVYAQNEYTHRIQNSRAKVSGQSLIVAAQSVQVKSQLKKKPRPTTAKPPQKVSF